MDGIKWLAFLDRYNLHGILCDDMGLGKTLQTITIVASSHYQTNFLPNPTQETGNSCFPSLVICPLFSHGFPS